MRVMNISNNGSQCFILVLNFFTHRLPSFLQLPAQMDGWRPWGSKPPQRTYKQYEGQVLWWDTRWCHCSSQTGTPHYQSLGRCEISERNACRRAQAREQTQTCSSLTVNGVADDLVRVVFGRLPGEQGRCAGVRRSSQVARGAGETFPHDDRQLGGGACCPQSIVCYALVITGILRCQLVDEQNSGALALDPPEWLDGLAVLQPVQYWRRLTCAVAHEPGSVAPGQGCCLGGLYNHRWCCSRWDTKASIWASTCCLFPQWQQPVLE